MLHWVKFGKVVLETTRWKKSPNKPKGKQNLRGTHHALNLNIAFTTYQYDFTRSRRSVYRCTLYRHATKEVCSTTLLPPEDFPLLLSITSYPIPRHTLSYDKVNNTPMQWWSILLNIRTSITSYFSTRQWRRYLGNY